MAGGVTDRGDDSDACGHGHRPMPLLIMTRMWVDDDNIAGGRI